MAARGIDVLFVDDPSNMAWLTGYDGWSFYVHQGVILALAGDPALVGPAAWTPTARGAPSGWGTTRIARYADHFVQSTDRHPMQHLAARLKALGASAPASASRWRTTTSRPRPTLTLLAELPDAELRRRHRAGELAARR